jgi:hypothetical protein
MEAALDGVWGDQVTLWRAIHCHREIVFFLVIGLADAGLSRHTETSHRRRPSRCSSSSMATREGLETLLTWDNAGMMHPSISD